MTSSLTFQNISNELDYGINNAVGTAILIPIQTQLQTNPELKDNFEELSIEEKQEVLCDIRREVLQRLGTTFVISINEKNLRDIQVQHFSTDVELKMIRIENELRSYAELFVNYMTE